jgi:capsular polysaccharide biosynthesis protein
MKVSEFESVAPPANALRGWNADFFFVKDQHPTVHFPAAVALFGHFMSQWGHAVLDLLPRVLGNEDVLGRYPILIQETTPANVVELLQLLVPMSQVVRIPFGTTVAVDQLVFPLPRAFYPAYWRYDADAHRPSANAWISDTTAFNEMQRRLALAPRASRKDRIYLSRAGLQNAQVVNISELEAVLQDEGFRFVSIEELSIEAARQLLSTAGLVVSSRGSNLLNLSFLAAPGLDVLVLGDRRTSNIRQLRAAGHHAHRVRGHPVWPVAPTDLTSYDVKQLPVRV